MWRNCQSRPMPLDNRRNAAGVLPQKEAGLIWKLAGWKMMSCGSFCKIRTTVFGVLTVLLITSLMVCILVKGQRQAAVTNVASRRR